MFLRTELQFENAAFNFYTAPHRILSKFDFKQSIFENIFILDKESGNGLALVSAEGAFFAVFNNQCKHRPEILDANRGDFVAPQKPLPKNVECSLVVISTDRFLSMKQMPINGNLKNIFVAQDGKKCLIGTNSSKEQMLALSVPSDCLIKPNDYLERVDSILRKPSPLRPNKTEHRNILKP